MNENLTTWAALPVPIPEVLSPRRCPNARFQKTTSTSVLQLVEGRRAVRLASHVRAHRVGVVLAASSCCASGVSNAVSGIFSYFAESGELFELMGIVGGPRVMDPNRAPNPVLPITNLSQCSQFNNLGGTELLGYSSFKTVVLTGVVEFCKNQRFTSLIVIAASDELADSAALAALLASAQIGTAIVPQSRNQHVLDGGSPTSLGFDSARRILAEFAGNIAVDCISSKKYWHLINCGDAALVGEVALLIRANLVVSEHDPNVSIGDWVERVADLVLDRAAHGLRSGVVMVSQCAFSRTREMADLRGEILALSGPAPLSESAARKGLSKASFGLLASLPTDIKTSLLRKRDSNGNPSLPYWSPEEFLIHKLKLELDRRQPTANELTFRSHFLAHESRCPVPTGFDCVLGATLGRTAAALIVANLHGFMASVRISQENAWTPCGVALSPAVIEQKGYSFPPTVAEALNRLLPRWRLESRYRAFGPLQLSGEICVNKAFLPLSLFSNPQTLEEYLDGGGSSSCGAPRPLAGSDPPTVLPVRSTRDMSILEQDRQRYTPKLPNYFTHPLSCVDGEICPRATASTDLLRTIFPLSHLTLPVEIVSAPSTHHPDTQRSAVGTPAGFVESWKRADDFSDDAGSILSEEENPGAESAPILQRCASHPPEPCTYCPSELSAPHTKSVGIVFLCSQVPGCHNVVAGLFDQLAGAALIGFLGGAAGLKHGWTIPLTAELVDTYRNQGGQDLLGHFGDTLWEESDYDEAIARITGLGLDALVVVGNLEGQLTAALLNEKLMRLQPRAIQLISVPASAENEIPFVRQSIGCDTVARVFSSAIANLSTEARSSRHRWYFVRLLSHHVSHLALECALATHPNIVLVTEEIAARQQSLAAVTEMIVECILKRSAAGKDYGIVLIPDGVVAAIPEIHHLLRELDRILKNFRTTSLNMAMRVELVQAQLSLFSCAIFKQLPMFVQAHLMMGTRHLETGKIDIANVATERILQSLVLAQLHKRAPQVQLDILVHSLAHQGRSSLPTNFDCDLARTCGYAAGVLVANGRTGLLVNVVSRQNADWKVSALPLVALVAVHEEKDGRYTVSVEPTKLVMSGNACRTLANSLPLPELREGRQPGPYQFATQSEGWCVGSWDSWAAYERIAADAKALLTGVQEASVEASVVANLEQLVATVSQLTRCAPGQTPDDILSTCMPQRTLT